MGERGERGFDRGWDWQFSANTYASCIAMMYWASVHSLLVGQSGVGNNRQLNQCRPRPRLVTETGVFKLQLTELTHSPSVPQCFMNAILQCLSNTRDLQEYCIRKEYLLDANGSGKKHCELMDGRSCAWGSVPYIVQAIQHRV